MKKCLFSLFFCVVLSAGVRAAETPVAITTFTWEDCLTLARQRNPDLLSSRNALDASHSTYNGSFNGLMPTLDLSNAYSKSDGTDGVWNASARAAIDLLNFKNNAAIRSARASMNQADAQLRLQSADTRATLRRAFASLLFAQQEINVSHKIRDTREGNAQLVALKYDSGRESKGNMLQAKAELLEAEADLSAASRSLRAAQQELGHQLGFDSFQAVVTTGTLTTRELDDLNKEESIVDAHPSVAVLEAQRAGSLARLKDARSSLWPTLSANYTRSYTDRDFFPGQPHWFTGAILSYPLFGAGLTSTHYAVQAANHDVERAEQDLRSTRNTVRSTLETDWSLLAAAVDQVTVQRTFLQAAQQRNVEALVRYSSGLMTFEEWELVVSDLVNFERSTIRAQRDAVQAEADWDHAIGRTLEE